MLMTIQRMFVTILDNNACVLREPERRRQLKKELQKYLNNAKPIETQ